MRGMLLLADIRTYAGAGVPTNAKENVNALTQRLLPKQMWLILKC